MEFDELCFFAIDEICAKTLSDVMSGLGLLFIFDDQNYFKDR